MRGCWPGSDGKGQGWGAVFLQVFGKGKDMDKEVVLAGEDEKEAARMGEGCLLSRVLPHHAAMWLAKAAKTGEAGSLERMIEIEKAIERCRRWYPERFLRPAALAGEVD